MARGSRKNAQASPAAEVPVENIEDHADNVEQAADAADVQPEVQTLHAVPAPVVSNDSLVSVRHIDGRPLTFDFYWHGRRIMFVEGEARVSAGDATKLRAEGYVV